MAELILDSKASGHLQGALTRNTVPDLWSTGLAAICDASHSLTISLQDISNCDSAGIAMLVAWIGFAKQQQIQLYFEHVGDSVKAIASVAKVDTILDLT